MRSGPLRHKINIQSYSVAASSYGEPVKTWANAVSSWWAGIQFVRGTESFGGELPERLTNKVAVFTIRYSTIAINETMRIQHIESGKLWNILDIEDTGYVHRTQRITAELVE